MIYLIFFGGIFILLEPVAAFKSASEFYTK